MYCFPYRHCNKDWNTVKTVVTHIQTKQELACISDFIFPWQLQTCVLPCCIFIKSYLNPFIIFVARMCPEEPSHPSIDIEGRWTGSFQMVDRFKRPWWGEDKPEKETNARKFFRQCWGKLKLFLNFIKACLKTFCL